MANRPGSFRDTSAQAMRWNRGITAVCLSVAAVCLHAVCLSVAATAVRADESVSQDSETERLIGQLDAADFSVRLHASRRLHDVSAADIPQIAEQAAGHSSAEVSARLLEVLEQFYLSEDADSVRAASDALEGLSRSERLRVAESAQEMLERHWKIRVELAASELRRMGAILQQSTPDSPNRFNRGFQAPLQQFRTDDLKVFLTDAYTGGSEGLKHFERMMALVRPQSMFPGLGVFVIDGHSLSEEDVTALQNQLGVGRVVARGRVALGITGEQAAIAGIAGCLLKEVAPNSSAADAGLNGGDLITALDDKPLRDFDDLVEKLKVFDVGDTVKVTVIRNFRDQLYIRTFGDSPDRRKLTLRPEQVAVPLTK